MGRFRDPGKTTVWIEKGFCAVPLKKLDVAKSAVRSVLAAPTGYHFLGVAKSAAAGPASVFADDLIDAIAQKAGSKERKPYSMIRFISGDKDVAAYFESIDCSSLAAGVFSQHLALLSYEKHLIIAVLCANYLIETGR